MHTNKPITKKIAQLHWEKDYEEIVALLSSYVFPWDFQESLEFALFRTYAVPSISKLLDRTGEFKNRTRKRYDDTELILAEIIENGIESERAKQAFRRMNAMHNSYCISNDDFLYVLSTFVFTPIEWIDQYGWRKLTDNEKQAIYKFNKEMGIRMNIKNIPKDFQSFYQFHKKYEVTHFTNAPSNNAVAEPTISLLLGFYLPDNFKFLGKPVAACFMDDRLLYAMSIKKPSMLLKVFVHFCMQIRTTVLAILPERKKPYLRTTLKRPTYPEGYRIEELGTFPEKPDSRI